MFSQQCNCFNLKIVNPWIPKFKICGDSTKVGSKLTPQEILTNFDEFLNLEISADFKIFNDFYFYTYTN